MRVSDLSKGQRMEFYKRGFNNEQVQQYLDTMETQNILAGQQNTLIQQQEDIEQLKAEQSYQEAINSQQDPRKVASMFAYQDSENLIKWQLELDSILERIEHMLRGDTISFENGHMVWIKAEAPEKRAMNDAGVKEVMEILTMYLNRNTILSNYSEELINMIMMNFGFEITDFFFLNYEKIGWDNIDKRKMYPLLLEKLIDVVHSAYLRALNGGERESLREARHITQSDQLQNPAGVIVNAGGQRSERGLLNPMRYVMGRYK